MCRNEQQKLQWSHVKHCQILPQYACVPEKEFVNVNNKTVSLVS